MLCGLLISSGDIHIEALGASTHATMSSEDVSYPEIKKTRNQKLKNSPLKSKV